MIIRTLASGMSAVVLVGVMTACGSSGSAGESTGPASGTVTSSDSSTSTSSTSESSSSAGPSSTQERTLSGEIVARGLTCVVFVADSGGSYALTGKVPEAARKVAAGALGDSIAIKVTGHLEPKAKSTCHLPVFVVSESELANG